MKINCSALVAKATVQAATGKAAIDKAQAATDRTAADKAAAGKAAVDKAASDKIAADRIVADKAAALKRARRPGASEQATAAAMFIKLEKLAAAAVGERRWTSTWREVVDEEPWASAQGPAPATHWARPIATKRDGGGGRGAVGQCNALGQAHRYQQVWRRRTRSRGPAHEGGPRWPVLSGAHVGVSRRPRWP